jgi:uncharacterized membrane protein YfcA
VPAQFIVFVLVGFAAQLVDGALGMAYGVTSTTLLLTMGLAPATASASVHLAEIGTTLASGVSHWRFGNLNRTIVVRLAIPGAVGAFVGAVALSNVSAEVARPIVSIFLGGLGVLLLIRFGFRRGQATTRRRVPTRALVPLGLVGGFLDAAGGGGWGPIVTPSLLASGRVQPRKAVGNADTSEFAVAVAASIGFLVALDMSGISLVIVGGMLVGGLVAAPVAAWLVRRLPARVLGVAVSGVIIVTNVPRVLDTIAVPAPAGFIVLGLLGVVWAAAMYTATIRHRAPLAPVRDRN